MSDELPYLSVVIPAYRSSELLAHSLPVLNDYLRRQKYSSEVLLVDDGSEDSAQTGAVAARFGCRFIPLKLNQGKGNAVRQGMLQARGQLRFFTDADLPYYPEAFENFLHAFQSEQADVVVGDRTLEASDYYSQLELSRRLSSRVFTLLVKSLVNVGLPDTQCGIKAVRGELVSELFGTGKIDGFAFDVELLALATRRGYKIRRVPVRLRSQAGTSVSLARHALPMLRDLWRIRRNLKGQSTLTGQASPDRK